MRLTGREAIEYAERQGLTLSKYTDPTEEARHGLTPDEAEEVAREDAGLIYIDRPPTPQEMLRALRAGPYAGKGGNPALAADLQIPLKTFEAYLYGVRQPSYQRRKTIEALWKRHGLHKQE